MCIDWDEYKPTNDLNLQKLKEVIKSGRAIAFVGAGCSMPLGYPSWGGLIQKMLDEIVKNQPNTKAIVEGLKKGSDLLYVAGKCKHLMGPGYYPFIAREFAPRDHTEEHKLIIGLPFYNYMTSNYDPCLDIAVNKVPLPSFTYKNKLMLGEFCSATIEPQGKIFHIHGRYDAPEDIVLTEDDYKGHYQEGFISSLRSIIMTRPVVFIGSGVNDLDFLRIMRFVEHIFRGFQDRHYAIIPCPDNGHAEYEAGRLTDTYNIVPVFYENPDGSHSKRGEMLKGILSYCNAKTATTVKPSPKSKEHGLTQYKLRLNAELANLKILDMSRPLNLSDIYIKICLREKVDRYTPEGDDKLRPAPYEMDISRLKTQRASESMVIEEALKGYKKLVILGDPGAGKTTLLRHITLELADNAVKDIKAIPIFVALHDYVNKFTPDLLDYLDADLSRRYGFDHARKYLETEFERGNVAVFFDGLDEVSGADKDEISINYNKVIGVINHVAAKYANCHIAVTCRKAGWRGGISKSFSIFEILDFTPDDITEFVEKWFRGEPEKAGGLNQQLGKKATSLVGNPLLLSFVCILYGKQKTFPERRVTLYEKCVNVLLNDWDESREIQRRNIFDQDKKRQLLQYIAYRFFMLGKRYFKKDELIRSIGAFLPVLYLEREDADAILNEISANHGLLKEQAVEWYGFIHLTVQEYFAACEMYERRDYAIAIENSFKPWWEEVILLFAGIGDSTELIKGLFEKTDDIFDHNIRLAGRCLAEKPTLKGGIRLREVVLNKLKDVVRNSKYGLNTYDAVDVLAENGEFDFLLGVLRNKSADWSVRRRIAEALGNIADSNIVPGLMPILRDEKTDNDLRSSIAEALGEIAGSSIVPELMPILRDEKTDNDLRSSIAHVLGEIAGSSIVPELMPILRDEKTDNDLRHSIAEVLVKIADSSIVPELMPILLDEKTDNDVRNSIAYVLGNIADSSIVPEFMAILLDEKTDSLLRSIIAEALGKIADSSSVPDLIAILRDEKTDNDLRRSIAEALGKIADSSIVPELMPILLDEKTDNYVRDSIAEALVNIVDSSIVPDLMPILLDEKTDNYVRDSIAKTLVKIADSSIVPELMPILRDKKTDNGLRRRIAEALGKIADSSSVPELMPILHDEKTDNYVRRIIAEALGNIADSSIVADLMPILRDEKTDNGLRRSIAKALGNIADSSIVADLMPILRDEKTDNGLRHSIAEALVKIADSSSVPDLIATVMVMDDAASDIWYHIVQLIGNIGNTKEHCIGLLKLRSKEPNDDTLHEALHQMSRRMGVTIDQGGNIIEA
ncbi:signal transduction protein with Nacht domain protein [Candidatus Magnetobacterium bavaricum]|uniref:Signal transduction protein with Nacht domain protein n=1 Tax=Candidatus Magnetobacterium bavaricum TaxID=29290 RepID=A0A0F3GZD5_9BACT|nr:signal transduction protein with Nacht domain protein [Candidatus Magnetobacterium bavaricum]